MGYFLFKRCNDTKKKKKIFLICLLNNSIFFIYTFLILKIVLTDNKLFSLLRHMLNKQFFEIIFILHKKLS